MKKLLFLFIVFSTFLTGLNVSALSYTTSEEMSGDYEYINEKELENGKLIRSDLNLVAPSKSYCINNIYYGDDFYIVVGYAILDRGGDNYEGYPFVSYYENYALVYNKIFDMNGTGEFRNIIIIDDYIVVTGNIEQQGIIRPYLIKLDKIGKVYKSIVLDCDKNTIVSNTYNDFEEIYLVGVTNASIINNHRIENKFNRVFLLVLDYNLNVTKYNLLGNEKNNKIYNVLYENYNFYLFGETGGNGDINVGSDYQKVVYSFDIFGEFIYSSKINNISLGNSDIVIHNRCVYLLNQPNGANYVDIYSCDYIEAKKLARFNIGEENEIIKRTFYKMNSDVLIIGEVINGIDGDLLRISYIKEKIEESIVIDLYDICSMENIYFDDELILFYGNIFKNNIYNPFASEVVFMQYKNNVVYVNNIEAKREEPIIENEKYGVYLVTVRYRINGVELYVKEEIYKKLSVNLRNKETYDLGVTIEANGDIYLNEEKINNGYSFNEEGEYLLEIKGNDVVTYYLIKVKKKTQDIKEISGELIKDEYKENKKVNNDEVVYSTNSYVNEVSGDLVVFSFLMIMIIFGFLVGIIVPVKRKKVKND